MKRRILLHRDNIDEVNEYLADRVAHQREAHMAGQWLSLCIFAIGILTDLFVSQTLWPSYAGYPFVICFFLGVFVRLISRVHNDYMKL